MLTPPYPSLPIHNLCVKTVPMTCLLPAWVRFWASGVTAFLKTPFYSPAEYVSKDSPDVRIGAILGLGIAYAGRGKEDVAELLLPLVMDTDLSMEVWNGGERGACAKDWCFHFL